jgi:hypothetical protein
LPSPARDPCELARLEPTEEHHHPERTGFITGTVAWLFRGRTGRHHRRVVSSLGGMSGLAQYKSSARLLASRHPASGPDPDRVA